MAVLGDVFKNKVFRQNAPLRESYSVLRGRRRRLASLRGRLVRYLVREGTNPSLIRQALVTLASRPGHEFWADSLPYAEADLTDVIGHRQVTDAYLASLVRQRGNDARLATLDQALVSTHPDVAVLVA
ncbi:MAG: hypothetical protein FWD59_07100 [Micrococcales bacterium]|nr:hypothetical protein [Micrococcales bacterium]